VRNTGCHFTNSCKALAQPSVSLEPLDIGHILKREQQARVSAGSLQMCSREPELDLAPVARSKGRFDAAPASQSRAAV
jgi:hypothetical protein